MFGCLMISFVKISCCISFFNLVWKHLSFLPSAELWPWEKNMQKTAKKTKTIKTTSYSYQPKSLTTSLIISVLPKLGNFLLDTHNPNRLISISIASTFNLRIKGIHKKLYLFNTYLHFTYISGYYYHAGCRIKI